MIEGKTGQSKRGPSLLHEVVNRRLDQNLKTQRAGRMSMLGTTIDALPLGFPVPFIKKANAIKMLGKLSADQHKPPGPAYVQRDHPGKYVATSLNYVADLTRAGNLVYCTDKRLQNSIKIKYAIRLDGLHRPATALISIYE